MKHLVWGSTLFLLALLIGGVATPPAEAHNWGCWIQADRNVKVRNTASRRTEATAAINEWNADTILNFTNVSSGQETSVYDGNYGNTGWGGLASIESYSGCTILRASAKLNLYYSWTSNAARGVFCQEVGHTFGLDHSNDGGCMGGGYWYNIGTYPAYTVVSHNISDIGTKYANRVAGHHAGEPAEGAERTHASWISNPRSIADAEGLASAIVVARVVRVVDSSAIEVRHSGGVDRLPTQRVELSVTRRVKGDIESSFVLFQNGNSANRFSEDPDYKVGSRHLLFLTSREDGTYRVVSPEGRFELSSRGLVPAAEDGFAAGLRDYPLLTVLRDIRDSMTHRGVQQ